MRVRKVLGHAVALDEVQSQPLVPGDELRGDGRRAAAGEHDLVQPEACQHLAPDAPAEHGDAQQQVELPRRNLREHALLELEPQARHRDKQRGPRTPQVRDEGVERLGEIDMRPAVDQRRAEHPGALHRMRQRQVGEHPHRRVGAELRAQLLDDVLRRHRDRAEAQHHTLRRAGGAGGINQHGEVVRGALARLDEGIVGSDDVVPGVEVSLRRQREGDAWQRRGDAELLRCPVVQLADEQQPGLAVLEHEPDGLGPLGGEDRHRGAARHPDGEFRHEEVGAVFRQDRDTIAGLDAVGHQVRRHAARLVHHAGPGIVLDLAAAHRLGQEHPVGQLTLVFVNVLQDELLRAHLCASPFASPQRR